MPEAPRNFPSAKQSDESAAKTAERWCPEVGGESRWR
jgi:hypothetical protein